MFCVLVIVSCVLCLCGCAVVGVSGCFVRFSVMCVFILCFVMLWLCYCSIVVWCGVVVFVLLCSVRLCHVLCCSVMGCSVLLCCCWFVDVRCAAM